MVQKQGKDAVCERNDDTNVGSEICRLGQHHSIVLAFQVLSTLFCAYNIKILNISKIEQLINLNATKTNAEIVCNLNSFH